MHLKLVQKIIDKLRGKASSEGFWEEPKNADEKIDYIFSKGGSLCLSKEYKWNNILEYAQEYGCKTFIETGTYLGDTVNAVKDYFDELHTIELSENLYLKVKERFQGMENITCYEGDSQKVLQEILPKISSAHKPIFWLDAHYSAGETARGDDKDTPITEELKIIFQNCNSCVILIDDAREFGTSKDYPSKFKVKRLILKYRPNAEIEIYDDIIRVVI